MRFLRLGGIVLGLAAVLSLTGCEPAQAPEPPPATQGYNAPSGGGGGTADANAPAANAPAANAPK
jgi:hypothetical protein